MNPAGRWAFFALVVSVLLVVRSESAPAQSDHALCFKVNDTLAKTIYHADLAPAVPFPSFPGCIVRVPPTFLCVGAAKSNVVETPPGAPVGPEATRRLCYKVKCPRAVLPPLTATDQFGAHDLTVKPPSILCTPVGTSPAPPFGCCQHPADQVVCSYDSEPSCANAGGTYAPYGICDAATGRCATPPAGIGDCCQFVDRCVGGPDAPSICASIPGGTLLSNRRCALGATTSSCLP